MLAFVVCAIVGLSVPTGCVMSPAGSLPGRHSIENFFHGGGCCCGHCDEPTCEAPYECDCPPSDCQAGDCQACSAEFDAATCPPHCHKKKLWHHLPKCKMYDPEAGIFNFCMPPACIHPPPPLPPGRFFPVPVRPAFAPQPTSMLGYGVNGAPGGPGEPGYDTAVPCR